MPVHALDQHGQEPNAEARILLDWAVLSTALCREAAAWKGDDRSGQPRVHALYLTLQQFLDAEDLRPQSSFDYAALVTDHLHARPWEDSLARGHIEEVRNAGPVVDAFRVLLSADTGREYDSDLTRLREAAAAWVGVPATQAKTSSDAPSCPVCDGMTAHTKNDELTESDCAASFTQIETYFSATRRHCRHCGRDWLIGYYEVDDDPLAEWGQRHFIIAELTPLDLYRIAINDGRSSLDIRAFEARMRSLAARRQPTPAADEPDTSSASEQNAPVATPEVDGLGGREPKFIRASDYDGDLHLILDEPDEVDPRTWTVTRFSTDGAHEVLTAERASNFGYSPGVNGRWCWLLADRLSLQRVEIQIPGRAGTIRG